MKTVVIGLGNPILGDDGVGWVVAEEVRKHLMPDSGVDVFCLALGGISLMEHLIGYNRAILVDAVTSQHEPGSVITSKLSDMPDHSAMHTGSVHDTSLQNALRLGETMGADLPTQVTVVGIATDRVYDFSEELSFPVAQAVSRAAQIVISLL